MHVGVDVVVSEEHFHRHIEYALCQHPLLNAATTIAATTVAAMTIATPIATPVATPVDAFDNAPLAASSTSTLSRRHRWPQLPAREGFEKVRDGLSWLPRLDDHCRGEEGGGHGGE